MTVWKSLIQEPNSNTNPIDSLPKVICGPILRTVKTNSVSVFIVLKSNIKMNLVVYTTDSLIIPKYYSQNANIKGSSGFVFPNKLGDNFYAICLTATMNAGNGLLSEGLTYFYDIIFDDNGTKHLGESTTDEYLKGGINSILYSSLSSNIYNLPSFILPYSDKTKLKVIHGSCRKPHGYSEDAMSLANTIIKESIITGTEPQKVLNRPQMMFLTGDQIYADDVSPILLKLIMDANYALLGWHESLDRISGDNLKDINYTQISDPIAPDKRGEIIVRRTDSNNLPFASLSPEIDVAGNHLMKLGEYFLMYVFCWSDSLWQDSLPLFSEIYPGLPTETEIIIPAEYPEAKNSKSISAPTSQYNKYNTHKVLLNNFKNTIPDVKKLLANIPSYMILDDHDVTDDLFRTGTWFNNINGNILGKRIIANGLAAYTIFQHWGNKIVDFATNNSGKIILDSVNNLANGVGSQSTNFSTISSRVFPTLTVHTGVSFPYRLSNNLLEFDFFYQNSNIEIIFLDTRTNRQFETLISPPILITPLSMERQVIDVPDIAAELTIVIAPSPVFGDRFLDANKNRTALFNGSDYADVEDWSVNSFRSDMLLSRILKRGKTVQVLNSQNQLVNKKEHSSVLLSGDIHFGFAQKVILHVLKSSYDFPAYRVNFGHLELAQLCSSSMKNETYGIFGTLSRVQRRDNTPHTWGPTPYVVKDVGSIFLREEGSDSDYEITNKEILREDNDSNRRDQIYVGFNNIGLISFELKPINGSNSSTNVLHVIQELYMKNNTVYKFEVTI